MTTTTAPARVVLVGAHGHGQYHLENLQRLQDQGRIELVGVCDRRPTDHPAATRARYGADLGEVLASTRPDATVICTPIHTHADLTVQALLAGSHVLLEKPPAPTWTEYRRVAAAAAETGRLVQVGFQDLGSTALAAIGQLLGDGTVGELRGIGGACAWVRPLAYFSRSPWAGRRVVDGVPVVDGALTNPFAHAIASALHLAGARTRDDLADVDVELYRANEIEADDTSTVRIRLASGGQILIAAALTAAEDHEPHLVLHGTEGRIVLRYKSGEVQVESPTAQWTKVFPRVDLLENLLDTAVGAAPGLLAPIDSMGAFMHVVETVRTAAEPTPVPAREGAAPEPHLVVDGIDEAVGKASERLLHFSELGLPWARRPAPTELAGLRVGGTAVASYVDGDALPASLSPRPHLHPVTTLAGAVVTDRAPADHRWHLGAGVGLQDISGHNLWGGRTYVRDRGYRWRDDHGRVEHAAWRVREDGRLDEELTWFGHDGAPLLAERRQLSSEGRGPDAWQLAFSTTLTNVAARRLALGGPGSNGRSGGGYGGLFWRLPPRTGAFRVFTATGSGEDAVHGRTAPWIAVSDIDPEARPWTLVFTPGDERTSADPWFVRVRDYPGIGSALAWAEPVALDPQQSTSRHLAVLVVDGRLVEPHQVRAALGVDGGGPTVRRSDRDER